MIILVNVRVPLTKGKTARQVLEEQGLWEEYKQSNTYDPMSRFDERHAVGTVPMTKDSEVSVWPWKEPAKRRNKRLLVHVDHVLNSVWSSTAVGILWSYFHWNSSSVLQGHLWHWISDPVGTFHPLWRFYLQCVKLISICSHTNTHSIEAELIRLKVRHRANDNLIQYIGIAKSWHQYNMFMCEHTVYLHIDFQILFH